MSEKVVGYTLITLGIFIIVFSLVNVVMVFTSKIQPVQLFNLKGISLDMSSLIPQDIIAGGDLPPELTSQLGRSAAPAPEIISPELLNQSSNLFAHVFLMGFLVSAGGKIATIGTMLVRPIVVKLKAKNEEIPTTHS
ncbi:hypothetical protein HY468_01800 [Candidatus Roizmanbacteria bacterium]|nr:hypothetical protein [Candidatus Roizmanbacteria bacterium]